MADRDKQLIERIRLKDRQAFDALFRKYYLPLLAEARELLLCTEDAENIVQDQMVELWENAGNIEIRTSVSAYLRCSVHNRCINLINRRGVHDRYVSKTRLSLMNDSLANGHTDVSELRLLLKLTLSALPEEQRSAFEMHRFRGYSYKDIAEERGVSEKTVEWRISQVIKRLRNTLKDYLLTPPHQK